MARPAVGRSGPRSHTMEAFITGYLILMMILAVLSLLAIGWWLGTR